MNLLALLIATTFFTGFLPEKFFGKNAAGGGLVGSIVGLLIQVWLYDQKGSLLVTSFLPVLISFALGILSVEKAEEYMLLKWGPRRRHTGELVGHDFNRTNIDEVHGQLIAGFPLFFFVSLGVQNQAGMFFLSFVLFRMFDTFKPWPIKQFEKLPGAWGIMLDDTVAGIISALIILIIRLRL